MMCYVAEPINKSTDDEVRACLRSKDRAACENNAISPPDADKQRAKIQLHDDVRDIANFLPSPFAIPVLHTQKFPFKCTHGMRALLMCGQWSI